MRVIICADGSLTYFDTVKPEPGFQDHPSQPPAQVGGLEQIMRSCTTAGFLNLRTSEIRQETAAKSGATLILDQCQRSQRSPGNTSGSGAEVCTDCCPGKDAEFPTRGKRTPEVKRREGKSARKYLKLLGGQMTEVLWVETAQRSLHGTGEVYRGK